MAEGLEDVVEVLGQPGSLLEHVLPAFRRHVEPMTVAVVDFPDRTVLEVNHRLCSWSWWRREVTTVTRLRAAPPGEGRVEGQPHGRAPDGHGDAWRLSRVIA